MATKRSRNVTDAERNILLKLIQPHMSIIENIKTDGTSNQIKSNTWENIRHQYNALQSTGPRTTTQLKAMFDTMKRKTRKDKSSDRVNTYRHQTNSTITERENEVLADLLMNKPSIDSSFDNQDEVWKTIAESYNQLQTSGTKTIEELKNCYKSLQKSASLDINKEKSQTYKTGGGKSEHQSSSISSKVMGMMGNRLESLKSPFDCDGDFPGTQSISCEELHGITNNQSCGSGSSPIYYTVGLDDIFDAQTGHTSTPCAKKSVIDTSIYENNNQPNEKIPNKKVPKTHTTVNKVYESLENLSIQRLGLYTSKEKFHEHYNDLKIKKAKIELEIAEIERNVSIEKLKSDKEHYKSRDKQNKLKEEILEHELNQKKQRL